jgi:hypothetical protein
VNVMPTQADHIAAQAEIKLMDGRPRNATDTLTIRYGRHRETVFGISRAVAFAPSRALSGQHAASR